jgi:hypothetical protein
MTTSDTALARRLSTRLDTLWDFGYEPNIPRLQRLGLLTSRVEVRYREIGLLDT